MPKQIQTPQTPQTPQVPATYAAPRRRRRSAAVIAQYIQDLTHPAPPVSCPA